MRRRRAAAFAELPLRRPHLLNPVALTARGKKSSPAANTPGPPRGHLRASPRPPIRRATHPRGRPPVADPPAGQTTPADPGAGRPTAVPWPRRPTYAADPWRRRPTAPPTHRRSTPTYPRRPGFAVRWPSRRLASAAPRSKQGFYWSGSPHRPRSGAPGVAGWLPCGQPGAHRGAGATPTHHRCAQRGHSLCPGRSHVIARSSS